MDIPDPETIAGAFEALRNQSHRLGNVGALQGEAYILAAIPRVSEGASEVALAALADMTEVGAVEVDWVVSSLFSDSRKEEKVVPSRAS